MRNLPRKFSAITVALFALFLMLALVVACGGAAETDQPAAGSTSSGQSAAPAASSGSSAAPAATGPAAASSGSSAAPAATEVPAAAPVAAPTATPQTAAAVVEETPSGRLTVGQKELGPFMGHPALTGNPQIFVLQTAPIGESLLTVSADLEPVPMLAREWEVSEDGSTWTFHLQEGVMLHKGYGEMTAEDVIWSMRQFGADGSKHPPGLQHARHLGKTRTDMQSPLTITPWKLTPGRPGRRFP